MDWVQVSDACAQEQIQGGQRTVPFTVEMFGGEITGVTPGHNVPPAVLPANPAFLGMQHLIDIRFIRVSL